jgi:hypothetical protein
LGGLLSVIYSDDSETVITNSISQTQLIILDSEYADFVLGAFLGSSKMKNNGQLTIDNCYYKGKVEASQDIESFENISGFLGEFETDSNNTSMKIENCYSVLEQFSDSRCIGFSLIGNDFLTFNNCYWDKEVSGIDSSFGGEGKSTAEMKTQSTFVNWDFDNIWAINPDINDGYPYLRGIVSPVEETILMETSPLSLFPQPGR